MGKMKQRYALANEAAVGSIINCPTCNTPHVKTTYNKVFCSNKTVGKKKGCKDKYWNTVTPEKRNNTTRISPASALFLSVRDTPIVFGHGDSQREIDREDRLQLDLEDDGSWDAHQASVTRCEWCECLICRCTD